MRAIRTVNNDYKAIIVVLDNFSTHVEFIWKSIKRVISIAFVENVEALRKIIERTFYKQTCRELIIC